jgi:hypothetical protein
MEEEDGEERFNAEFAENAECAEKRGLGEEGTIYRAPTP